MGKYDEAIADYDASLKIQPNKVASLYGRGMAKRRKGDYAAGNADISAARALKGDVSAEFARYGLLPPLTDAAPPAADNRKDAKAEAPKRRPKTN
jgi:tetratricopeptide (TPR) repeat protein